MYGTTPAPPPMPADEERRLAAEAAALRGDPARRAEYLAARNALVAGSLSVVRAVIKARRPSEFRSPRLADSLQAGAVGLTEAADAYDPAAGHRFAAFAWGPVWWRVADAIRDDALIRLPHRPRDAGPGRYGDRRQAALTFNRGGGDGGWSISRVAGRPATGPGDGADRARTLRAAERLRRSFAAEDRAEMPGHWERMAARDRARRLSLRPAAAPKPRPALDRARLEAEAARAVEAARRAEAASLPARVAAAKARIAEKDARDRLKRRETA